MVHEPRSWIGSTSFKSVVNALFMEEKNDTHVPWALAFESEVCFTVERGKKSPHTTSDVAQRRTHHHDDTQRISGDSRHLLLLDRWDARTEFSTSHRVVSSMPQLHSVRYSDVSTGLTITTVTSHYTLLRVLPFLLVLSFCFPFHFSLTTPPFHLL